MVTCDRSISAQEMLAASPGAAAGERCRHHCAWYHADVRHRPLTRHLSGLQARPRVANSSSGAAPCTGAQLAILRALGAGSITAQCTMGSRHILASCPAYKSDAEGTHCAPLTTANVFEYEHMQVQSAACRTPMHVRVKHGTCPGRCQSVQSCRLAHDSSIYAFCTTLEFAIAGQLFAACWQLRQTLLLSEFLLCIQQPQHGLRWSFTEYGTSSARETQVLLMTTCSCNRRACTYSSLPRCDAPQRHWVVRNSASIASV